MHYPHGRTTTAALVAVIVLLLCASSAFATVPRSGWGFGLTDPDIDVGRSLDHDFSTLDSKTFRMLLPWDVVDYPDQLSQASQRIQLAREAGVEEIVVSFGPASGWVEGGQALLGEKYRPTPELWISKVRQFIDLHDADVGVWGPANEPNEGVGWLRDGDGPAKLAGYYAALYRLVKVERAAQGDKLLSPEFHDHLDANGAPWPADPSRYPADYSTLDLYIDAYESYVQGLGVGDGFGDAVGWHPYKGTRLQSRAGTDDLVGAIPAGRPVWITEVGAVIHTAVATQTEEEQDADVQWLVDSESGLAKHDRVGRIYYWHLRNHNPGWDSALVDSNGRRRPSWYTWCAASHRDDPLHTGCRQYVPYGLQFWGAR
jgi:hypothetical protein